MNMTFRIPHSAPARPSHLPGRAFRIAVRGITLVELLLASVLGLVVLLGIGQIDVTRIRMGHDIRGFSVAQMEASYGLAHMVKQLEGADRIFQIGAGNLQFRVPLGTDFDSAANYVWKQYKHDSGAREIRFYDSANPCPPQPVIFHDIDTLTIAQDLTDSNELEVTIASTPPVTERTTTYKGEVTIRGGSGVTTGLAPFGVSEPPAECP